MFEPASTANATRAGEPRRELKRPASRRERGAPVPAVGAGVAGVRPSPPPPPPRPPSSEWVNPPPPTDSVTHRPVTHRPVRRRVTDVKVTAASRGRLPPGISFSPPRPPASTRTKRGGWSDDSDDEEPSVRKRLEGSIPAGVEFHQNRSPPGSPGTRSPPRPRSPRGGEAHRAIVGERPGGYEKTRARDGGDGDEFGAMDKKRVAARARHFLRPAWTCGKVRGKDTFKEYAKRATQAGFAAACALRDQDEIAAGGGVGG